MEFLKKRFGLGKYVNESNSSNFYQIGWVKIEFFNILSLFKSCLSQLF